MKPPQNPVATICRTSGRSESLGHAITSPISMEPRKFTNRISQGGDFSNCDKVTLAMAPAAPPAPMRHNCKKFTSALQGVAASSCRSEFQRAGFGQVILCIEIA